MKTRASPPPCVGLEFEQLHKIKVKLLFVLSASLLFNFSFAAAGEPPFYYAFFLVCIHLTSHYLYELTKQGVIECPIPDKDIRRFDANIRLFPPFIDNDICPLTINNTLLQSCYLRNTEWACGVAVYTGNLLILFVLFHVTARTGSSYNNHGMATFQEW